jgi:enoyl-CoA hydratase
MPENLIDISITDRIAVVRLDRGDGVNALSADVIGQLTEAARRFPARPDLSAVILTAAGANFTLGANLKDPSSAALRKQKLAERRLSLRAGPELCEAWEKVDALTIVAVEGWCVCGGAALAAACDLRVMGAGARLYVPEVARGMNMSWGAIPRLVALVGPARAKRLAALCEKVDAPTALAWGLADRIAPDGEALKHDVNVAALALARAAGHRDLEAFALMERSDDFAEGVAAFLDKRDPTFTGD